MDELRSEQKYSTTSGNMAVSAALVASTKNSKRQRQDEGLPSDKIRWGKEDELTKEEEETKRLKDAAEAPQYKPDFGLSGALAKDERTGNVVNGIVLKFTEPYEAAKPDKHWRLYVYKGDDIIETLYIHRRSCFLFGRETKVADVPLMHPSVSAQHAVIQYREIDEMIVTEEGDRDVVKVVKPYLMDLKSTHGTKLNGEKIEDSRYYELRMGDLIQFGQSSRDYVLMHDKV
jgi:smad nuclear-interacting protein 1